MLFYFLMSNKKISIFVKIIKNDMKEVKEVKEVKDNKMLLSFYYKGVLDVFNSEFINKDIIDTAIKLRNDLENN